MDFLAAILENGIQFSKIWFLIFLTVRKTRWTPCFKLVCKIGSLQYPNGGTIDQCASCGNQKDGQVSILGLEYFQYQSQRSAKSVLSEGNLGNPRRTSPLINIPSSNLNPSRQPKSMLRLVIYDH